MSAPCTTLSAILHCAQGLYSCDLLRAIAEGLWLINGTNSAATNAQSNEGVAVKKITNVFSKKILAKRALREIKLLQHFRGKCDIRSCVLLLSLTFKQVTEMYADAAML